MILPDLTTAPVANIWGIGDELLQEIREDLLQSRAEGCHHVAFLGVELANWPDPAPEDVLLIEGLCRLN